MQKGENIMTVIDPGNGKKGNKRKNKRSIFFKKL